MTFRTVALVCAAFALTSQVQAATKTAGDIRQIDTAQGMAAVQTRGSVKVGETQCCARFHRKQVREPSGGSCGYR